MNIFLEKKTNIGFYNLKDSLGFLIFFKRFCFFSSYLLVYMFKLIVKSYADSSGFSDYFIF